MADELYTKGEFSEMDLFNNSVGANIGASIPRDSREIYEMLLEIKTQ